MYVQLGYMAGDASRGALKEVAAIIKHRPRSKPAIRSGQTTLLDQTWQAQCPNDSRVAACEMRWRRWSGERDSVQRRNGFKTATTSSQRQAAVGEVGTRYECRAVSGTSADLANGDLQKELGSQCCFIFPSPHLTRGRWGVSSTGGLRCGIELESLKVDDET